MDKGLKRRERIGGIYEERLINVYEIATHRIIFTGNQCDVANRFGVQQGYIPQVMKHKKKRLFKTYALRYVTEG